MLTGGCPASAALLPPRRGAGLTIRSPSVFIYFAPDVRNPCGRTGRVNVTLRAAFTTYSALAALEKLRGLSHLIYLCARYIGADGRKVVAGIRHSRVILQGRRLPAPITYIGGCPTTGCSLFYFPVILHVHLDSFHHAPRLCSVDNRSLVLKIRMYDNLNHTARLIRMRIDVNQHFAVGVFVDV